MKVSVFGPSGMLGRQVVKQLKEAGYEAVPVYRRMFELLDKSSIDRAVEGCDLNINCAGVIPVRNTDIVEMIRVNAEFPHLLVGTQVPTVLVSTDCVFSGRSNRPYMTSSQPDPKDYYGRSKVLGEVAGACIVRTSFIGCEHGFMHWIMQAGQLQNTVPTQINGYKNALWTGSTVSEVAKSLVSLVGDTFKPGVIHLATERVINKYDLAVKIVELKQLNLRIQPVYDPIINRALVPSEGHVLPDIDEALAKYVCSGAIG